MQEQQKKIAIGIGIFLATIIGLWGVWKVIGQPAEQETAQAVELNITEEDRMMGAEDSKIVLVEYSDLQCPACKAYHPIVKQVLAQNDDVAFVYRHFPLTQHQHAVLAAQYTEAAAMQDAFFEMHDLMFERQDDWAQLDDPTETFIEYGKELELDTEQLQANAQLDEVAAKVEADLNSGIQFGVNSTPTFFLNGVKIQNVNSVEGFQALIDSERAALEESGSDDDAMINEDEDTMSDDKAKEGDKAEEEMMEKEDTMEPEATEAAQ